MLGLGDPVAGETDQVRGAGDEVGDTSVDAGGVDLDQHLRRPDLWPVDGAQLQHLGRAVSVLDDRTHRLTLAHHGDTDTATRTRLHRSWVLRRLRGLAAACRDEATDRRNRRADGSGRMPGSPSTTPDLMTASLPLLALIYPVDLCPVLLAQVSSSEGFGCLAVELVATMASDPITQASCPGSDT